MDERSEGAPAARMIYYAIPEDQAILAKVGAIALRHSQLDHALVMTIKSLAGLTVNQAVDALSRTGSAELRQRVRKLARQRLGEGQALLKVEALIERCGRATSKRNELLHSVWARELDGEHVMTHEQHGWVPLPSEEQLLELEITLESLVYELNHVRLQGFLREALEASSPPKPGR